MDFICILNRFWVPFVLVVVFFCVISKKAAINKWVSDKSGKIKLKRWVGAILSGVNLDTKNAKKTLLLAVLLAFAADLIVSMIFKTKPTGYGEPLPFALVTSGFLNPVAEEFLVRGLALGMILYTIEMLEKKVIGRGLSSFLKTLSLLVISVYFTIQHPNLTAFQFWVRFTNSTLCGILYIASNKNLLPAITAHAAHNLLLTAIDLTIIGVTLTGPINCA